MLGVRWFSATICTWLMHCCSVARCFAMDFCRQWKEWRSKDNMLSWMVEAHHMPSRWWQEALLENVTMSSILMTRKEHFIVGRLSGSAVLMFVKNEMLEAQNWEFLVKVQPLNQRNPHRIQKFKNLFERCFLFWTSKVRTIWYFSLCVLAYHY